MKDGHAMQIRSIDSATHPISPLHTPLDLFHAFQLWHDFRQPLPEAFQRECMGPVHVEFPIEDAFPLSFCARLLHEVCQE